MAYVDSALFTLVTWARHVSILHHSMTPIGQNLGGMAAIHRLSTGNVIQQPLDFIWPWWFDSLQLGLLNEVEAYRTVSFR